MKPISKCLLLAWALTAVGAPLAHGESVAKPLDFALHLSRLKTGLHSGSLAVGTTVKQIGITSFNTGNPTIQPGLFLGYAWIDVTNQSLTAGMEPEGFYVGPALRSILVDADPLTLNLTAAYLYQRFRDNIGDQTVTLEWYQPQLDVDAKWRIVRQISLNLGGRYGRVDVDEKLSGTVNQSITLKKDAVFGGHAGLELDLGDSGRSGFMVYQDVSDGVELYFQQQF